MLKDYLLGKRTGEKRVVALVEMAFKIVERDDVLISLRRDRIATCILCGRHYDAEPVAVKCSGHTEVVLLCERCDTDHIDKKVLMVADAQLADTCFLWQIGDVINCLDDELFTESIHAKR